MAKRFIQRFGKVILGLLVLWLGLELFCRLVAEILWFQEVKYLSAFLIRLGTQVGLWAIALVSAGFLLFNINVAEQNSLIVPNSDPSEKKRKNLSSKLPIPEKRLDFRWLLLLVILLSLLAGLIFYHYSKAAFISGQPNLDVTSISASIPSRFEPKSIWENWAKSSGWQLILLWLITLSIIIKSGIFLRAIAILLSLSFGVVLSGHWARVLQYFHAQPFARQEPLLNRDISFYVFSLPVWELLEFGLSGLILYGLIAVSLVYLLSGNSLSEGRFPKFTRSQQQHLYALSGAFMLCVSLSYWLRRYELVYSTRGVVYGASYTDVTAELPTYSLLSLVALAIGIVLLWRAIFPQTAKSKRIVEENSRLYLLIFRTFSVLLLGIFILSFILPEIVQSFIVQPNEVARERIYIERSIKLTREAFELDKIEVQTFNPLGGLTLANLQKNQDTTRNIRLWDIRPLLEANRQLQQIRPYYKFPSADIDRYTLISQLPKKTENRQVIVAARELDYNSVPEVAKTWVNEHLVYTHGYGFTMSPVNTVAPGGLPDYFVKDIGVGLNGGNEGNLQTSNPRISYSVPIFNPRIYFGEITDTYVMTGTKVKELDYPSGDDNVYNTYDGFGGIKLSYWWHKLIFAKYLNDWQMLLTGNFTNQTKVLFRRNIDARVRAIAPFLKYDREPYLVVTNDPNEPKNKNNTKNYLYWIIDAYTTSDHYPYSDPGENQFNYIRNSVKVVIDAYNGDVDFYVAYPQDPIIKSLSAIFLKMFKPLSAMPPPLRRHLRYPVDLYSIQSERLLAYHMTDPRVFYNREDLWKIPSEIYGGKSQPVEPYYLIMKLPTAKEEEFILLLPFTPTQRNNLIAWLAGRSDGKEYGKLLLYQFPKQQLIYGPEQIEALINQDPVISQQISLWNRQGSRAIQGNLLVIPIEKSLLYVEPLYLEAEQNSLPTLVRVIVAYENRIVMAETLEQAFTAIFEPLKPKTAPIVRPVEGVD